MKKFMKGCALAAVVLLIVGFVLAAAGGTASGAEKIRDVVDRVTGGRVQLDLTGSESWGITVGEKVDNLGKTLHHLDDDVHYDIEDATMFDEHHTIASGDVQETFEPGEIRSLEVEVGGCSFSMQESADDKFHVSAEGIGKLQCYVEETTLHVKATVKTAIHNGDSGSIVLYVPVDSVIDQLDMEVGAGIMNLGCLKAEKVDLEVGAGQIFTESVQAKELGVSVGVGTAQINGMQVTHLEAEAGMGNLKARGTVEGTGKLECAMGNIALELSGASTAFDYNIECGVGKVQIGEDTYSGLAKEKSVHNGAGHSMDVDCSMGNVEIVFAE